MVTHFAIEPHAFLAAPDANGVTVWSPTQHPYVLQRVVAAALQWPIARVRIVAPDPGGGFGGKGWPKVEPLMAWLALRLGRPVRLVLTLEETFQAARRASARIHARTGFASDGRIVFQDIRRGLSARRVRRHRRARRQQGQLFRVRAVSRRACAHRRASAAVAHDAEHGVQGVRHAAGVVGGRIAVERSRGRARHRSPSRFAAAIFRQKARRSTRTTRRRMATGMTALTKAAAAIAWDAPLAPNRGRGISLGLKSSSTASRSVAIVRLHFDGSASVLCGTSDMGQGARTVLMQIAAQELGLAPDRIAIVMGDTSVVPFDSSTSASRSTVFMGNAIIEACDSVKKQLRQIAEADTGATDDDVARADLLKAHFGPTSRRSHRHRRSRQRVRARPSARWTRGVLGVDVRRVRSRSGSGNRRDDDSQAGARQRRRQGAEPAAGRRRRTKAPR